MGHSRIGEDLEARISGKKHTDTASLEKKVIILSYISRKPCCTSYIISKELHLSERGVLWHLRTMEKIGVTEEVDIDGKKRFLISDQIKKEHCRIFSALLNKKIKDSLISIVESPGITGNELEDVLGMSRQNLWKTLKKLNELSLIKRIKDGRYVRYHPSEFLSSIASMYEERRNFLASKIENAMKSMGLNYITLEHRNGILYVRMGENDITFSTDPLKSSLEE